MATRATSAALHFACVLQNILFHQQLKQLKQLKYASMLAQRLVGATSPSQTGNFCRMGMCTLAL